MFVSCDSKRLEIVMGALLVFTMQAFIYLLGLCLVAGFLYFVICVVAFPVVAAIVFTKETIKEELDKRAASPEAKAKAKAKAKAGRKARDEARAKRQGSAPYKSLKYSKRIAAYNDMRMAGNRTTEQEDRVHAVDVYLEKLYKAK